MSSKELAQTRTLPPLTFMSNQSLTVGHHSLALPALGDVSHNPDPASGMVPDQSWVFGENPVGQLYVGDISAASCQAHVAVDQSPGFEGNFVGNPLGYLSGLGMVPDSAPSDQSPTFHYNPVGMVFSHEISQYLFSDNVLF